MCKIILSVSCHMLFELIGRSGSWPLPRHFRLKNNYVKVYSRAPGVGKSCPLNSMVLSEENSKPAQE